MNNYLKKYAMILHTIGPVHVGSGYSLSKKEYILQKEQGKILVPDLGKLYSYITDAGLQKEFDKYLLTSGSGTADLKCWLQNNGIKSSAYSDWVRYELGCGDFLQEKGAIQIMPCLKDNYGLPYIPGSTLKGMLRNVLLAYELSRQGNAFEQERKSVPVEAKRMTERKKYLSKNSEALEAQAFYILERRDKNQKAVPKGHAVNDCMSGIIISDSTPIQLNDLTLCQKRDEDVNGNQHTLNILRESVKPDCDIHFTITIDSQLSKYGIDDIFQAIQTFNELYYTMYLSHFCKVDRPEKECVWVGGGTGFFTKTVLYPLLGYKQGIETAIDVFEKTLPAQISAQHKHYKDKRLGVSPHILKCTQYKGKKYQMGMCKLMQE